MKTAAPARCSLWRFVLYFLRLGTLGFGGPIALAGHMQQDLVEQRGWISAQEYKEGLALAQLAPGPLAAQLAMYLGWVRARALGATLVALAFVGPFPLDLLRGGRVGMVDAAGRIGTNLDDLSTFTAVHDNRLGHLVTGFLNG